MKGLLIKDFQFLKRQKQFLFMVAGFGLFFAITNNNPAFPMTYMTVLVASFSIGTLNYDEFENGGAYLFTMPITRKDYVKEKYIFSALASLIAMLLALIFLLIMTGVKHQSITTEELWVYPITSFFTGVLITSLTIPMQIKFGMEKARIAMLGAVVGTLAFVVGIAKLGSRMSFNMDGMTSGFVRILHKLGNLGIAGVILLTGLLLFVVSCKISIRLMEQKEY